MILKKMMTLRRKTAFKALKDSMIENPLSRKELKILIFKFKEILKFKVRLSFYLMEAMTISVKIQKWL